MKTLSDGTQVSSRSYYYLLDWNDADDFKTLNELGLDKLKDANSDQYLTLWEKATRAEFEKQPLQYHYNAHTSTCLDPCPCGGGSPMIGSVSCQECQYNMGFDTEERWVICKGGLEEAMSSSTCWGCELRQDCAYAFDPYNKYGDCLREK